MERFHCRDGQHPVEQCADQLLPSGVTGDEKNARLEG
jgi:hypothetical protein